MNKEDFLNKSYIIRDSLTPGLYLIKKRLSSDENHVEETFEYLFGKRWMYLNFDVLDECEPIIIEFCKSNKLKLVRSARSYIFFKNEIKFKRRGDLRLV